MRPTLFDAPSITARVYGGLGNQCFIYAAARAMADRVQGLLTLDPTVMTLDNDYRRPFLLPEFHVRVSRTVEMDSSVKLHLRRLHVRVQPLLPWGGNRWLFEKKPLRFQPEIVNWRGMKATLDGYWQSELYFRDDSETVAADLVPRASRRLLESELGVRILESEHSVALHVRSYREVPGKADGSFALPAGYFRKAVELMRSRVPAARFFLFSDDTEWARSLLDLPRDVPCTTVAHAGGSPVADFYLMSLCRHAVVANSSFSWWAAWLGEQRRKAENRPGLIVRPLGGFGSNLDFYPVRWQGVEGK